MSREGSCSLKEVMVFITQTDGKMSLGGGEAEIEVGWIERGMMTEPGD